jgi:hypothetical protein
MICHRFRTIFVHIPKTAGQSVELVFLHKMGLTPETRGPLLLRENTDPRLGPERLAHLTAAEYINCGHVAPIDYAEYFKFAIVRNPWARLVSAYKFRTPPGGPSFRDFVLRYFPPPGRSRERLLVETQASFLCNTADQLLVDKVARHETLDEDMSEIFQRIFGERIGMPRINVSPDQSDYRRFYDDDTRAFVEEFYRADIEMFRYSFE